MSDQGVMFSPNAPLGAYIFSRLCLAEYVCRETNSNSIRFGYEVNTIKENKLTSSI